MKKFIAIVIVFIFVLSAMPVFAQTPPKRPPAPSQRAYEKASEKSAFNRAGDWFATVGKSDEEKAKIIAERDAQRAVKHAEKQAKRLQKQAEGQAKGIQQTTRQHTQQKTQQQAGKAKVPAGKGMGR
jgi:hypothetical protein